MLDSFTRFTKLYPITKANTKTIVKLIKENCIKEVGLPISIISDHGTQFKGVKWQNAMKEIKIRTYKTSVYHPSSNPAERMLKEVGRLLRTYCHDQHLQWSEYVNQTEKFINLADHDLSLIHI